MKRCLSLLLTVFSLLVLTTAARGAQGGLRSPRTTASSRAWTARPPPPTRRPTDGGEWNAPRLVRPPGNPPAQELARALDQYSRATGVAVLVDSQLSRGRRSLAVDGEYTAADALRHLLGGTGLMAIALGFMLLVAAVNFRGVGESVKVNVVLTLVELSGLLLVIFVGLFAVVGGNADFTGGLEDHHLGDQEGPHAQRRRLVLLLEAVEVVGQVCVVFSRQLPPPAARRCRAAG